MLKYYRITYLAAKNKENKGGILIGGKGSDQKKIQGTIREGDSWVSVSCEVEDRCFNVLFNNRRPGFSGNASEPVSKVNLPLEAKKLGKTYKKELSSVQQNRHEWNNNLKKLNVMKSLQLKKILIPTDFSETGSLALNHAVSMARISKAQLYLLHVVEPFEYTYSIYEPEVIVKDTPGIAHTAKEKLEKLADRISKDNGITVNVLVENGKPASEIASVVKDLDIDLVVMGTHGAHGFEEYFIGSNAHKVVNHVQCPVITIQQQAKKVGFSNIVMPIDNSLYSRQKVDYVIKLARLYDSRVHILGLIGSDDDEIDEKKFEIKLDSVENALKKSGLRYLRKLIKGNNIAEEAMNYSDKIKADLIVIMTDHESNMKGSLLGALAKQIVNHSKIPVMSIRPLLEGNLDPVHLSAANPLF